MVRKIGDRVTVWYGSGFTRTGRILSLADQDGLILVRFDYDISDDWVREDQIC